MVQPLNDRVQAWLVWAVSDARRRGLTDLEPLLESLGGAVAALRSADWNDEASGTSSPASPRPEDRP